MSLTSRRLEFLSRLKKLYEQSNFPVHYTALAEVLGVSKWTAYSMLKKLAAEGLLAVQYQTGNPPTGETTGKWPGRSQVFFSPTEKAQKLLQQASTGYHSPSLPAESESNRAEVDWSEIKNRFLDLLSRLRHCPQTVLHQILQQEIPDQSSQLVAGAHQLTLLLLSLANLGQKACHATKKILQSAPQPEMALSFFTGTILGFLLAKGEKFTFPEQVFPVIEQFQKRIAAFAPAEQKLLADYLHEALETI